MDPPCQPGQDIAGTGEHSGQRDEPQSQGPSQVCGPVGELSEPVKETAVKIGWRDERPAVRTEDPLAEGEGGEIQGHDGEWVGVEGREECQRQIDPEHDTTERRAQHLEGPGDQAAEQADGHGACDFTVRATADLDNDGIGSVYERSGHADISGVKAEPGLRIENPLE